MEYGRIEGLAKPVPRLIYGALAINRDNCRESFEILDRIVALGGIAIDTAHGYSGGDSERVLGDWMQERKNREDVIIITKGGVYNEDRNRVTPFDLTAHMHDSLARLKTNYIDIYLLHRDDPAVAVGPLIDVLNRHKTEGRIRLFGASNWCCRRIEEANTYAEKNGLAGFSVSSPQYSLAVEYEPPYPGTLSLRSNDAAAAAEEQDWYAKTGFPLFTWSSLARGFFSGKFDRNNVHTFDDLQSKISARCYGYEENFERLDRARELAREKDMTVAQIAVAFIFNQPLNIYGITGSRKPDHFRSSIDAQKVELTRAELDWLDLKTDTTPF